VFGTPPDEEAAMIRPWSCLDLPPVRDDEWVDAQFGHD
jgi:hypothetical protein